MTYSIRCEASEGIWEFIEEIPTEAVVAPSTEPEIVEIVEPEQPLCREVDIANHNGMKSWMPYNKFDETSQQYILQQNAKTDSLGFRYVSGRYCVAVGSGANVSVGQYIDIALENGEIVPCIIADIKADCDTNADNLTTTYNGCVCEFLVDESQLMRAVRRSGDVSSIDSSWNSPIKEIIVYENVSFFGGEDDL